MHGFCTVFARFQGMQWVLWLAKYDKGCRNCWAENHDALHKNDANSKLLKSECSARWALLIRGPGIRVPSSAPKSHEESQDSSWDFPFIRHLHGLCTVFAHRRESRVFPCIVCILCIVSGACRASPRQAQWNLWQRVSRFTRCVKMVLQILLW